MHHVFIFGAGASRDAGGPLMFDFFDVAERLHRLGKIDDGVFSAVFRGLALLQGAHSKSVLDIDNVEAVMGAFEMATLAGRLGDLDPEEIEALPSHISKLVAQTIEQSIGFTYSRGQVYAPRTYGQFGDVVKRLIKRAETMSLITFNYDLALDVFLLNNYLRPDYGFPTGINGQDVVELLKLHGSLAWTKNKSDKDTIITADLFSAVHCVPSEFSLTRGSDGEPSPFLFQQRLSSIPDGTGVPVIVPPTWSKNSYYRDLKLVWRKAAQTFERAENIYVFGYSLPETDSFFRLLFSLGTIGPARLKRFWVFDPAQQTSDRFRRMLGPSASARFQFFQMGFDKAASTLTTNLDRDGVI